MDICPFLGPLIPLFWISGDVFSWFESQSGFCLICFFCRGKCNVHSQRSTSGATHANRLVTSTCAEVRLGLDSNRQSPDRIQMHYHCASKPARMEKYYILSLHLIWSYIIYFHTNYSHVQYCFLFL